MNILPSSSDDNTRRAFLAQVENLLPAASITWTSVEYTTQPAITTISAIHLTELCLVDTIV
ncbi:MAG: hypothetical protein J2P37_20180 [Ktedonobacteraceae bacterium]|nr:hypothetical protein [Ktedonobacteraceae bacterium]